MNASANKKERGLWLWPGLVALGLQWLLWFALPADLPYAGEIRAMGSLLGGVAVGLWWLTLSRAGWGERLGAAALVLAALALTPLFLHESLATAGRGVIWMIYAFPLLALSFVVWAWRSRGASKGFRRASLLAAVVLPCAVWTPLRTEGLTGAGKAELRWRWSETAEERTLGADSTPASGSPALDPELLGAIRWSGFRGQDRNGSAAGVRLSSDWNVAPPAELWSQPVGPAWSSFASRGELLYTQEQRGEEELVSCYLAGSGELVWRHADPVRFWEANAGAGPRGTPYLHGSLVLTFGGTGILNALDAATGALLWTKDVGEDAAVEVPEWGFASSPLVVDRTGPAGAGAGEEEAGGQPLVIVAAAGRLAAYDLGNGERRWLGPEQGSGYSSPHYAEIAGEPQVLLQNSAGLVALDPADGALLWEHAWTSSGIVQPAVLPGGKILLGSDRKGLCGLRVSRSPEGWQVERLWSSARLKPYFSDFVVHGPHAYGFDGGRLVCVEVDGGKRMWKDGDFGSGQMVLARDSGLLLVLSEEGELALVAADPAGYRELGRVPALAGKTWNHPVLVDDRLYVRNGEEMASFRLPRLP